MLAIMKESVDLAVSAKQRLKELLGLSIVQVPPIAQLSWHEPAGLYCVRSWKPDEREIYRVQQSSAIATHREKDKERGHSVGDARLDYGPGGRNPYERVDRLGVVKSDYTGGPTPATLSIEAVDVLSEGSIKTADFFRFC